MNRDRRLRRIRAMREVQLLSLAAEYEGITPEDFDKIPFIEPTKEQWGNHEVLLEDPTLQFKPEDIDSAISRSMNRDWITIPAEARRKGVPTLYYLDPARATEYEKYFGIYTDEYGYLHTPATQALHNAMISGMAARSQGKLGNDYLVRWLKPPADYATSAGKGKYLTLDPESERSVISASTRLLEESHEKPSLQRRLRVHPTGLVEQTTSHSRGIREIPYGTDVSPELTRKTELLERAMDKDLAKYPRLKQTVDSLNSSLANRMDALMREFRGTNRAMNFEDFTKEEMEDIVRQGILRLFLEAITEGEGAFAGTELGLPSEYRFK